MNLLSLRNRKTLGFSISILNTILFLMLLLSPAPFIKPIKICMWIIMILIISLITLIKTNLFIPLTEANDPLSDTQNLYKENLEIMNKFLRFKDLQVCSLESEIDVKDRLYKQLFDFSPDAFVIFNEGTIAYFNDAFTKLMNTNDPTTFVSKEIQDFIHPTSLIIAKKTYNDLLTKTTSVSILDLKIVASNNIIKKVRVSSSITFFESGYYVFSCLHDLSTHYEQERIKMELENNIANEKFKVEFFANISHDIKTPVNVIYSAIQLQNMYIQSNNFDKALVYNNVIKQNCLRLQKLLNDVLDLTKIDANHFEPKLELCNIICGIERITQSITSYMEDNEVSIIFDTNVEDKFVLTDLSFIERIMLNLISNAIKYGEPNGHVWVTLHDEGNHLIISVQDDGIGITRSHIPNIFKRFHKTNQNSGNTVSSNGIGLSLVKSMVETLGGTIFCLSQEGIGSEFVIILPMESDEIDDDHYCEYATSLDLSNNLNIELSDI